MRTSSLLVALLLSAALVGCSSNETSDGAPPPAAGAGGATGGTPAHGGAGHGGQVSPAGGAAGGPGGSAGQGGASGKGGASQSGSGGTGGAAGKGGVGGAGAAGTAGATMAGMGGGGAGQAFLGSKIVGGYWQMWQGPKVAEITQQAPQYNLQYAAFGLGAEAGTGKVYFSPEFSKHDELKADIAASQQAGSTWLLSVGGGGEENLVLLQPEHVDQMVDSLISIVDDYGFQGIDFDLESGPERWNAQSMKAVSLKLKEHYGKSFLISAAPRPYEDEYRDWAVDMGDALDLFGYQFYDAKEFNDPNFLRDNINFRIQQTLDLGIPASKLLIGCITYSQYPYGHNTVEVYRSIFQDLEQKHPDLRGVFIWETSLDKKENWSFAKQMGAAILP